MIVRIENIGGIWYVNNKRLGRDVLDKIEIESVNEFFAQWKAMHKE